MIRLAPALLLAALPAMAFAAGTTPPVKSETVEDCPDGQVYDAEQKICVAADETGLRDADRLEAARDLASFGRAASALAVLAALDAPGTAEALTVRGYATRKAGDMAVGLALYRAALALEPDNFLTRSYLGQALAEIGDEAGAQVELDAIRMAGGRGTWPETSLARAIDGSSTY